MRRRDRDRCPVVTVYLHVPARDWAGRGNRINKSSAVPRSIPGAFSRLNGHGPVFATGPNTNEVRTIGAEFIEYIFGLREVDVLVFTNESQILADGKKRVAVRKFEEAPIIPACVKEAFARRPDAIESNAFGLNSAGSIFQSCRGEIGPRLHRSESCFPCPPAERVVPVRPVAALIPFSSLVVLTVERR